MDTDLSTSKNVMGSQRKPDVIIAESVVVQGQGGSTDLGARWNLMEI